MRNANAANWTNIILGAWLFISPWVLFSGVEVGATAAASWNFWIVGAVVAISAGIALAKLQPWEEWTNLILGAWLFLSPWLLGYSANNSYFWNAILVGAAVVISSGVALPVANRKAHYGAEARVR